MRGGYSKNFGKLSETDIQKAFSMDDTFHICHEDVGRDSLFGIWEGCR